MISGRAKATILAAVLVVAVAALAALASAEVIQRDKVRVSFNGELSPSRLPRQGLAPVRVSVSAKIVAVDGTTLPQLRRMEIAINRHGHFDPAGLPVCHIRDIQPTTTADALAACRDSLVGEGRFSAQVQVTEQAPFPSRGKVYAFNGRYQGTPAILAHVYGTQPAPTSYTVPFVIRPGHGDFGTVLEAALPDVVGSSGYVTGLSLNLGRSFTYRGATRSYLSAGCPAPPGFPGAPFRFARASFGFIGGRTLTSTLTRNCQVR